MTATLRAGFVPLVDAAPLIIADAMGFAGEEGLHLNLTAAPSWAALRDMLAAGQVDAAQMLAPVPVALSLGLGGAAARFEALSVMNMNGNVLGVSRNLAAGMQANGWGFDFTDARSAGLAMVKAVEQRLHIGVPFLFSMHLELVTYWLDGLGVRLPKDLQIVAVPPARIADALAQGEIDAFCVGEPHGSVAVDKGQGVLLLPGSAIWAFAPEKVLAARTGWADAEPDLAGRLIRAVWRAGRWLMAPQNRVTASDVLAAPERLNMAAELIERSLTGRLVIAPDGAERFVPGFIEFHAGAASFPWRSQAAWMGMRLARRYGLDQSASIAAARAVFRCDLHRLHLRQTGADLPGASEKVEGSLTQPCAVASERGKLILPIDRFFDAKIFDPANPTR